MAWRVGVTRIVGFVFGPGDWERGEHGVGDFNGALDERLLTATERAQHGNWRVMRSCLAATAARKQQRGSIIWSLTREMLGQCLSCGNEFKQQSESPSTNEATFAVGHVSRPGPDLIRVHAARVKIESGNAVERLRLKHSHDIRDTETLGPGNGNRDAPLQLVIVQQ